jgi:hypothetical protein
MHNIFAIIIIIFCYCYILKFLADNYDELRQQAGGHVMFHMCMLRTLEVSLMCFMSIEVY